MKKVLLFASALVMGSVAMAQQLPLIENTPNSVMLDIIKTGQAPKAFNDEANAHWYTKNLVGVVLPNLSIIDTTLQGWYTGLAAQYALSIDPATRVLTCVFTNKLPDESGTKNWKDFNFRWAKFNEKGDAPKHPFADTVASVSGTTVTYKAVDKVDTLFGAFVNIMDAPVVTMKVKTDKKVNVRLDLIDVNGRIANGFNPHHWIEPSADWTVLSFRWDARGSNPLKPNYGFEGTAGETNVGMAIDGWANDWWGVKNGREAADMAFLFKTGTKENGGIVLNDSLIAGLSISLDDADRGALDVVKTVQFKDIVVGDTATTLASAIEPVTKYRSLAQIKDAALKQSDVKTVAAEAAKIDLSVEGLVIKVKGAAKLTNVLGETVAVAVDGQIVAPAPGTYFVVTSEGSKGVVVQQ